MQIILWLNMSWRVKICEQLYDLASLAHGQLSPERMTNFVNRSNDIMMIMAGQKAE